MRIALIHDDLTQRGGAERVVEAMHQIWPDAPIYVSVYDPENTFSSFKGMDIRTSFMQKIPLARRTKFSKFFLILYPIAFETLDLRNYDVVLSHGTRFSHGVITSPDTCHIHYCHTPARFAWRYYEYIEEGEFNKILKSFLPFIVHDLRIWDYCAAQRVNYFFSNSYNIAKRILKFYNRNSDILYPPVETSRFTLALENNQEYFLVVSRLLPYKRIDLAIEACNRLNVPLKVVGSGPELNRLRRLAGPTVEILGHIPDGEVERLFANCRAFLFPGEEDFGIAPLEAMAAGRPVIAYRAGGAVETVLEGKTGLFFNEPTVDSLVSAIREFDLLVVNPLFIRAHAEKFDIKAFQARLVALVELRLEEHHARFNLLSTRQKEQM